MPSDDTLILTLGLNGAEEAEERMAAVAEAMERFKVSTDEGADSTRELTAAAETGGPAWQEVAEASLRYADALKQVRAAQEAATTDRTEDNLSRLASALDNAAQAQNKLKEAQIGAGEVVGGFAGMLGHAGGALGGFAEQIGTKLGIPMGEVRAKFAEITEAAGEDGVALLTVGGIMAAIGVAAYEMGERFAESATQIRSMSVVLGITPEMYQLIGIAAEKAGMDAQSARYGLMMLNAELARAKERGGSGAAELRKLGIAGMSTSEAIESLVNRLSDANTAQETTSQIQEVLGVRGGRLLVVLNALAEEHQKTGRSIHEMAEEYEKTFNIIDKGALELGVQTHGVLVENREAWEGIKNELGENLQKAVQDMAAAFGIAATAARIVIGVLSVLVSEASEGIKYITLVASSVTEAFAGAAEAADEAIHGHVAAAKATMADTHARITAMAKETAEDVQRSWNETNEWFAGHPINPEIKQPKSVKDVGLAKVSAELSDLQGKFETASKRGEDMKEVLRSHAPEIEKLIASYKALGVATKDLPDALVKYESELAKMGAADVGKDAMARLESEKKTADATIAAKESALKRSVKLGRVSGEEEIAQMAALHQQQIAEEVSYLTKKEAVEKAMAAAKGEPPKPIEEKYEGPFSAAQIKFDETGADAEADIMASYLTRIRAFNEEKIAAIEQASAAQLSTDEFTGKQMLDKGLVTQEQYAAMLVTFAKRRTDIETTALEAQKKISEDKGTPAGAEEAQKIQDQITAVTIKGALDQAKAAQEGTNLIEAHQRELIGYTKENADAQIDAERKQVEYEAGAGQITVTAKLNQMKRLASEQYTVDSVALAHELTTLQAGTSAYDANLQKQYQLYLKFHQQIRNLQNEELNNTRQVWTQMTDAVNQSFFRWTSGQERFRYAFVGMWAGLVNTVFQSLVKMLEKKLLTDHLMTASEQAYQGTVKLLLAITDALHITSAAKRAAAAKAEDTTKTAVVTTGNAQRTTIQQAAETLQVTMQAAEGAAAAYASVMEGLPFPANVAAAPGVAAQTFATILSMAAFDEGGVAAGTGIAMLHDTEVVMPQDVSKGFRSLASGEGLGGGGISVPIHMGAVSAIDAQGVSKVLAKQGREIQRQVVRAIRNQGATARGGLRR